MSRPASRLRPARASSSRPAPASASPPRPAPPTKPACTTSNNEIADALFLSPATVRTHVGRVMAKLNARSRAQLVVLAVRAGLTVAL
ncbi:response regulator transcription factor [Streptomyces sp. NPDC088560]|uniref:response regulator transcription factor n=1 Tax=Streptomyces sp. NPDC088560 TaxID=3365868 RepID=UPI00380B6E03